MQGAELDESKELANGAGELTARLKRLALLKGNTVADATHSAVIISADTVVEVQGEVLGKPRDVDDARGMLMKLSGRTHRVHSAVAVQHREGGFADTGVETTRVTFDLLDNDTIDCYIARAIPLDMAGAYAIQGLGALLVQRIDGDYSNVVGLPLRLTARLLTAAGLHVL